MVDQVAKRTRKWPRYVAVCAGLVGSNFAAAQTTNGANMENYFNDLCNRALSAFGTGSILSTRKTILAASQQGQSDLYSVCIDLIQSDGAIPQSFFDDLSAGGFEAFKLDALLFAQTENDSIMDRLQALRRGKRNGNQTAFDLNLNGNSMLGNNGQAIRGGGAGADDADGLLNNRWGVWLHANSAKGAKDATELSGSLDTKQTGIALGSDYRLGSATVLGASLSMRDSKAKFGPGGIQGGMASKTWTFSIYGSSFIYRDLYVDAVVNYGKIDYDTRRNIFDSSGLVADHMAHGSTNGNTLSAGTSLGYDFASGGFTLTPSLGYFYVDSKTDAFEEEGAGGLDLSFGKQHFHSSTAHIDLNLAYAINSASGVWQPYVRTQWVREFADGIDAFDVRFVNDADPTAAPLPVQLDKLDRQYWRMNAGLSAQFAHDVAAYLDYQQLVAFDAVSFHNITLGMRMQF